MYQKNKQGSLYSKVLNLLCNRPCTLTYQDIANETGLPEPWLKAFATGKIADPSVNRIEILYIYLANKSLNV